MMATLENWENALKQQLATADLIGELDLTQEQTKEIGRLIRGLIGPKSDFQRVTQVLRRRYPRSLAAFLVFQGIYGYDGGDYWSAVCSAIGIAASPNCTTTWGQAFELITEELGLNRPFAGHRYVGAILGHGGIPARSLPDFFARMLQPSVVKAEWIGLGTSELIDEWLSGTSRYSVDKPVLRFLEYGGRVAEDFVERCRQMAMEYASDGAVPLASDVGLPETVVASYQDWIDSIDQPRSGEAGRMRYRRPQMLLDPWWLGVYLHLPEQLIPASRQGNLRWEIEVNGQIHTVPVRLRRVDLDLKTVACKFPLGEPASTYLVQLHAGDDLLEAWPVAGPSPDCPLMIFDPEKQTPVATSGVRPLPGQELWVIAAPHVTVDTKPRRDDLVREELPRLPWGWHEWQRVAVDLAGVDELIWQAGGTLNSLPVRDLGAVSPPVLVGASQVLPLADPVPLFVGKPPRLHIPWPDGEKPDGNLHRWCFELRHEWEAEPAVRVSVSLDDLRDRNKLLWQEGTIEIPLDAPELLGSAPIGQFRAKVRGPLGNTHELRFRLTPQLSMTGHEQAVLPDVQRGALPTELLIETDANSELQFLQDEPSFGFQQATEDGQARYYWVEVPSDRVEAPLRLVRALEPGRNVYIPLRVPIRRLRWMLVLDAADLAQPTWLGQAPAPISLGQLEQSEYPYLIVELPEVDNPWVRVHLRFLAGEEDVIWGGDALASPGASRFRRFDLRLARDSLRQSRSALLRAELTIQGLSGRKDVRLLAFSVRQGIFIQEVTASPQQVDGRLHLHLRWQPAVPLKGRFIRFWSQTCPWRDPVGFSLPDDARQEHVVHLAPDALPAGKYLVEFTVRDPWLPKAKPERPAVGADNVIEVRVGDLEQRLVELVDGRDEASLSFDERCERILIRQALDDQPGVEQDIQLCYEHVHLASVQQLMTLTDGLETSIPTVKAMRYKLYRAERIREMLDAHQRGQLSDESLNSYLSGVPQVALQSTSSCEALLAVADDRLRLRAALSLIKKNEPSAVKAILAWAEEGKLSEADTLRLLDSNLAFTTRVLDDMPETHLVVRLWERLAKARPDRVPIKFVRPGQWVRCQAGWGRVERIEGPDGISPPVTPRAELAQGYRLHVVLRPGEDSEPVVIDVGRRQVLFTDDATIYHCSACCCCATRDEGLLYNKHKKIVHQGEVFGFSPVRRSVPQTRKLEFFLNRPAQLWA